MEDFTTRDVKELQDESDRKGMAGISPRYVIFRLSSVKEGTTSIARDEKEKYLNFIYETRKEYDDIAKNEEQKAFVYSFEESARTRSN